MDWTDIKKWLLTVFVGLCSYIPIGALAQNPFQPKIEPILRLDSGWVHHSPESEWDGRSVRFPFSLSTPEQIAIETSFELPDSLPNEDLYLYFEGLTWEADLYFNGAYVAIYEHPFESWPIKLSPDWLKKDRPNQLLLKLRRGQAFDMAPKQWLGVFREIYLLPESQLKKFENPLPIASGRVDTVAVVAPFYFNDAYQFNPASAAQILLPLQHQKLSHIYFPFEPGYEMRKMASLMGLREVHTLADSHQLALINAYPYELSHFIPNATFWLDGHGFRTPHYGSMTHMDADQISQGYPSSLSNVLVLMILFPIVSLFLIKLLSPGFFQAQRALLMDPKLNLMSIIDFTSSNSGLLTILMLIKILNQAIFLSLLVYYISLAHQWQAFNIIQEWSLFNQWFYGRESLWSIFQGSIVILTGWFILKHLLIVLIGRSFRIKNMLEGVLSLEVVATYPLIMALSWPMALILFMNTHWGGFMVFGLILLLLIYLLRRMYVFYVGLTKLFTFSSGVKFLYICALNLMPYLIWV